MSELNNQIILEIKDKLNRQDLSDKTITIYIQWLNKLLKYYNQDDINSISFQDIKEYLNFITVKKRYAAKTIHQAKHSLKTIFVDILNKPFDFKLLEKRPKIEEPAPETITKTEVVDFLNNVDELKYKLFFSIMYSAGLMLSETKELRMKDFDFNNRLILIKSKYTQGTRKTELSSFVEKKLQEYIRINKPTNYLFANPNTGRLIHDSTIQKVFKKTLLKAGNTRNLTPKCLKYSYVKHVEEDGVPLPAIMKHLNMVFQWRSRAMWFYSKIVERDVKTINNPLDKLIYSDIERINIASIERMLLKVSDPKTKDFILEGIQCIKAGVYRAAVIFIWSASIYSIYQKCLEKRKTELNSAIRKHYPSAPNISKIEDFAFIKDRTVLETTVDLSIYDKDTKNVLVECLDLRNKCGHPSNYRPKPIRVAAFLEDVVNNVFTTD